MICLYLRTLIYTCVCVNNIQVCDLLAYSGMNARPRGCSHMYARPRGCSHMYAEGEDKTYGSDKGEGEPLTPPNTRAYLPKRLRQLCIGSRLLASLMNDDRAPSFIIGMTGVTARERPGTDHLSPAGCPSHSPMYH